MNLLQPRPSLDVRHKILMGACMGCLALGYLMGIRHAGSERQQQFLGAIIHGLEKAQDQTERSPSAFDKAWTQQERKRDERDEASKDRLKRLPKASRDNRH